MLFVPNRTNENLYYQCLKISLYMQNHIKRMDLCLQILLKGASTEDKKKLLPAMALDNCQYASSARIGMALHQLLMNRVKTPGGASKTEDISSVGQQIPPSPTPGFIESPRHIQIDPVVRDRRIHPSVVRAQQLDLKLQELHIVDGLLKHGADIHLQRQQKIRAVIRHCTVLHEVSRPMEVLLYSYFGPVGHEVLQSLQPLVDPLPPFLHK
jgi:hypothetical protein